MGLFGTNKTASDGQRSLERQAVWEQALAQNRLPGFVAERLRGAASGKMPWMATMTPAELLVSRSHGIRPVATVTGTCALHYGFSWTRGHAEGWRTAATRLAEEALLCGANAVIDVKMRTTNIGPGDNMDYTLVGTAVKVDGLPPSTDPVIATVSALEFARLLEAGIVPVGLAIGAHYEWFQGGGMPANTRYGGKYQWVQSPMYNVEPGWATGNQPLASLGHFWENLRRKALHELSLDGHSQGNGVLAHIQFGQMLKREGNENSPPAYLGRYIIMGTVVDTRDRHPVPHTIESVVDMRDGDALSGGSAPRNTYPTEQEEGAI